MRNHFFPFDVKRLASAFFLILMIGLMGCIEAVGVKTPRQERAISLCEKYNSTYQEAGNTLISEGLSACIRIEKDRTVEECIIYWTNNDTPVFNGSCKL